MCLGVPCCTQKISSSIWHRLTHDSILNFGRLSTGPILNLGATCFCTEWRARANFRRLLLRDSPSSQLLSLPKFNFGSASPTSVLLPESRFWHTSCTLGFKMHFKLVDILGSEMETPCTLHEMSKSLHAHYMHVMVM